MRLKILFVVGLISFSAQAKNDYYVALTNNKGDNVHIFGITSKNECDACIKIEKAFKTAHYFNYQKNAKQIKIQKTWCNVIVDEATHEGIQSVEITCQKKKNYDQSVTIHMVSNGKYIVVPIATEALQRKAAS